MGKHYEDVSRYSEITFTDLPELYQGRQLRDDALKALEARRSKWITMCRTFAINHARRAGQVSINDVRACFELPEGYSANTWGAILRCPELKVIGMTQTNHKEGHARRVLVYGLK